MIAQKTLQKLKTRLASVMINARFNRNQHSNYVFIIDPYSLLFKSILFKVAFIFKCYLNLNVDSLLFKRGILH